MGVVPSTFVRVQRYDARASHEIPQTEARPDAVGKVLARWPPRVGLMMSSTSDHVGQAVTFHKVVSRVMHTRLAHAC